jgi:hypothetical protein
MKKNFVLKSLIASVILALTAASVQVNAQNVNNPWHLIVMNEGNVEQAAFNVETLTDMTVSGENIKIDMTWDGQQKSYTYPISSIFTFDPRANGTGTGNENIAEPEWNVYYSNGNLHFSKQVSNVAVYTVYGALTAKFTGNYTSVPVYLNQGLYIVRAGNKSAKLFVSNTGYGGTTVASKELIQTIPATATAINDPPPSLRAGETIKIYWKIKAGKNNMTVEISDVVSFRFTSDNSIIFTLKNGNTIELTDYQGIEFSIEPVPPTTTSNWDLDKTFKFGGAAYGLEIYSAGGYSTNVKYISAVYKEGIKVYDVNNKKETKYIISNIRTNFWSEYADKDRRISIRTEGNTINLCMSSVHILENNLEAIIFVFASIDTYTAMSSDNWSHNGKKTAIPSIFNINTDGSLTVNDGKDSYTFTANW